MKITLDVYLPASGRCYEVVVESDIQLHQLTPLIAQAVERSAGELFHADGAILCDRQSGNIFDINMTPDGLGLKNGSAVMLI